MLLYLFYICLLSLHLTFFGDLHWGSKESNQGPQTGTVCANKQLEPSLAKSVKVQGEASVAGLDLTLGAEGIISQFVSGKSIGFVQVYGRN